MNKILVFGDSAFAEHIYYQFTTFSDSEVVAFVVDKKYRTKSILCDLPVIDFEGVEALYPPEQYKFFVAMGYTGLNALRETKCAQVKALGYNLVSFIHPTCIIAPNVTIGENCMLLENTVVQPFAKIADNVFVWAASIICHHSQIGAHTFIASHVCVNGNVVIKNNCFIGANATIRNDIEIQAFCIIGAGCTILESTQAKQVYVANKSRLLDIPSSAIKGI